MRNFLYQNLPMFAPIGPGGPGGGGITRIAEPLDQVGDEGNLPPEMGNQEDGDLSLDPNKILNDLWGEEGDGAGDDDSGDADDAGEDDDDSGQNRRKSARTDDDDDSGNDDAETRKNAGKAASEQLAKDIKGLALPDDLIPADFNPADPAQFKAVVGRVQQHTAASTLRLVFPIIDQALKAQRQNLVSEIGKQIQAGQGASRVQAMLEAAIPESTDPALSPVVKTLFSQARERHKKLPEAIAATKSAMKALGIKLGSENGGVPRRRTEHAVAENLDKFFSIPPKPGQQNPAQRRMASNQRK